MAFIHDPASTGERGLLSSNTKITALPSTYFRWLLLLSPFIWNSFLYFLWLANSYSSLRISPKHHILYVAFYISFPSSPRVAKCHFTVLLECPTQITIIEFTYWVADVCMWLSPSGFWAPGSQQWCLDPPVALYLVYALAWGGCSKAPSAGLSREMGK